MFRNKTAVSFNELGLSLKNTSNAAVEKKVKQFIQGY